MNHSNTVWLRRDEGGNSSERERERELMLLKKKIETFGKFKTLNSVG